MHIGRKKTHFYQLDDFGQLEESYFQLLEPKTGETEKIDKFAIELLVVPGLVYDRRGYRIGFGGGYYDRFLADFHNETVSLAHKCQIVDKIQNEPFDIPVKHLIVEQ